MDASFSNKRHFDHSTLDPHLTPTSSTKRRHLQSSPATPKGETLFRLLCPATKTGGLIGKGGAIIRQVREETGAKIRIDDSSHGSEERVILIIAADSTSKNRDGNANNNNEDSNSEESGNSNFEESPAQKALLKVFERILKVDEERSKMSKEESDHGEDNSAQGSGGIPQGPVVCRLLAASNQIGCVLGRGGKIIEKIRQETGAQVRVLPKDQLPDCASPGDELIQMAGKFLAVKKALLSVSSCLQDNPRADAANSGSNRPMGLMPHGYGTEGVGNHHRMAMEEEVMFRLLCQVDKVGSLIGKGGSIRRALQTETGATIKIADSAPESDERVVILEQRHSPAQDAVIRVHGRISEIGFEPGAAIVARLLVHSRQIGCLWGKGGMIISEMRRITGASIHIFPKEQVSKYGMPNDEVVQVIGSLQSVQDALFQITGRLRETMFPMKYFSNVNGPAYMAPYPEMPPPSFRPRHDPASSPGYPSPIGHSHNPDRVAGQGPPFDPTPLYFHGDHPRPTYFDRNSYPYGNERAGYGHRQPPPGRWTSQSGSNRYGGEVGELEGGLPKVNDSSGRNETGSIRVEIVIPENLFGCVYGEKNVNLGHIEEISGAKVGGVMEGGKLVLSGTSDKTHTAQCLLHGFILCDHYMVS
ncbi:K Homology domain-containing protein [Cynara cardunculus var. scolymus]|uniref:K Homology domain-containing protein n=1 Tax=Cynara cardunculus var. scolymus TaxID=59895 RepID=A0A124SC75_CYNCS|nr:K Homology domain-containing protein [Cynara cardunculus var. scolymus]